MSTSITVGTLIPPFQVLSVTLRCIVQDDLLKVSTPSEFHPKRSSFEYPTEYSLFSRILCSAPTLWGLYCQFPLTNRCVLRCVRKVLMSTFRPSRLANLNRPRSRAIVGTWFSTDKLILLLQMLFQLRKPSGQVGPGKAYLCSKDEAKRCVFD